MNSTTAWWAGPSAKVVAGLLCAVVFQTAGAQIVRALGPPLIDHGRVPVGRQIEDTLRFVNGGRHPIDVQRVKTTCGCMATAFKPFALAPGDTASLPYFFDTHGYSGLVRKSIVVELKGAEPSTLHFQFQVHVDRPLEADPRFCYLPGLVFRPDTLILQAVMLHNRSPQPVRIDSVGADTPEIGVSPRAFTLAPGDSARLEIRYRPKDRVMAQWTVSLRTDHPQRRRLHIPFYVTFRDE